MSVTVEVEFSDLADLIKQVVDKRPTQAIAAGPVDADGVEEADDTTLQAVAPTIPTWFEG